MTKRHEQMTLETCGNWFPLPWHITSRCAVRQSVSSHVFGRICQSNLVSEHFSKMLVLSGVFNT
jgi:hypothetical protein